MEMQLVLMVKISVRRTLLIHQTEVYFTAFWVQIWPMIFFFNFCLFCFVLFSSSDNSEYALDYT